MQILIEPSFFFTNNTSAPHGDTLGLINPYLGVIGMPSVLLTRVIWYEAFTLGAVPSIRSMVKSI